MLTINSNFETKANPHHPDRNEDAYLDESEKGIFAVFDGMGGLPLAQTAAKTARDQLKSLSENINKSSPRSAREDLKEIINEAQNQIKKEAKNQGYNMGPGTTASILTFLSEKKKAILIHSGDSRIYRYQEKKLEQLTQDHDLIWEAERKGEISTKKAKKIRAKLNKAEKQSELDRETRAYFEGRNIITAGLGLTKKLHLQTKTIEINKDDVYILSTDGIHDNLSDARIKSLLEKSGSKPAKLLLNQARDNFKKDNLRAKPDDLTVGVVKIS